MGFYSDLMGYEWDDTLWLCQNSELEIAPVEIVDFPIAMLRRECDIM